MRFHETIHGVYFDDLDAFQVLHNARYLLLFERTIGSFWQQLGWGNLLDGHLNPDQFHVVRANHFEYLRPVKGTGSVRVRVFVEKLGRTSMEFGGLILPMDSDAPYARGGRTVVKVDPEGLRPSPWSEEFRSSLAPWLG
jgi:acyl-CoA thioester hydrolase